MIENNSMSGTNSPACITNCPNILSITLTLLLTSEKHHLEPMDELNFFLTVKKPSYIAYVVLHTCNFFPAMVCA